MSFMVKFVENLGPSFANEFSPFLVPAAGKLAVSAMSLLGFCSSTPSTTSDVSSRIIGGALLNTMRNNSAAETTDGRRTSGRRYTQRASDHWKNVKSSWKDGFPTELTKTAERRQVASKQSMVRMVRFLSSVLTMGMGAAIATGSLGFFTLSLPGLIGLSLGIAYTLGMFIATIPLSRHYLMNENTTAPSPSENTDDIDLDSPENKSNDTNKWNFLGSSIIWPLAMLLMTSDDSREKEIEMWERRIHN